MTTLRSILASLAVLFLLAGGRVLPAAEPSVAELTAALQGGTEASRVKVIDSLAARGESAAEAVQPLTQLLSDKSPVIRAHAAFALGHIGNPAKPAAAALTALAKDEDQNVRRQAVQAIVAIRPGPQVMVPLMIKLLEDSDPGLQVRILHAVSEAGEAAVPGLIEGLKNPRAAYWACLVLREIGPPAKAAVPALTSALQDKRPEVRREATLALGAMENAAAPAAGEIAKLLDDKATAPAATMALAQIGQLPPGTEQKIRANAAGDDKFLSTVSLWTLARLHPQDKELGRQAAEQIVGRLADKDEFVRLGAARALASLRLGPDIMLPIMEKALRGADETTARHALDAVAALGPPAVPRLIEALKHEKLRAQIAYILGRIGPPAAAATDSLAKLLSTNDANVVTEAAMALAKIGPAASAAAPALAAALKNPNCPNPHAVAYALGTMGPAAVAAQPELLALAAGKDEQLAVVACSAAIQIDRSPQTVERVIPSLVASLGSSVPETRQMAADTLKTLGPAATSALAALQKATSDSNPSVRAAAEEAISAIRGGK
jgi:HEAT repeat protein